MTGQDAAKTLTFEQLAQLREKTERLSQFFSERLTNHFKTLYPILAPRRVFGKYLGSKDVIPQADKVYRQLVERFKEVSGSPFDVPSDLDEEDLSAMEQGIDVYPWEYTLQAGDRAITISSPVRWIMTYRSAYSLSEMRRLMIGSGQRKAAAVRHFIVNALASQIVVNQNPGIAQLFKDLRYDMSFEAGPGLGKLTVLTIASGISSFRPPDDLILSAVRLSGVPAFIELVDAEAVSQLADPLRQQVEKIFAG